MAKTCLQTVAKTAIECYTFNYMQQNIKKANFTQEKGDSHASKV